MRRILLLITDLQIGGTPTVVRELAIRLREPGRVEISVACLAPWGPVADELQRAGVPVTALGATSAAHFPIAVAKLDRLIANDGIDTVFSFLIHANAVAAAVSAFFPNVRFLQSIQTTQPNPRWHWRLQRLVHAAAEKLVMPSPSAARVATEWAGVPKDKVVVIPNAVDLDSFDAIYNANSRRPAHSPVRVGFIGRLDPIKRVPLLVEAFATDPRAYLRDAQLHIYGEGPDRGHIESIVARRMLAARVCLHGYVERPQDALNELDVLVLPSEAEGFGLVLIEAMAAGVPVVGTAVPGISDVIQNDVNGLLVGSTPKDIRDGIQAALNPQFRSRIIPAAREDVERQYNWTAVITRYRRLLRID